MGRLENKKEDKWGSKKMGKQKGKKMTNRNRIICNREWKTSSWKMGRLKNKKVNMWGSGKWENGKAGR